MDVPKYVKDLKPGDMIRLYDDHPDHEWGDVVKLSDVQPSKHLPNYTFLFCEDNRVELLPSKMVVSLTSMIRFCYL